MKKLLTIQSLSTLGRSGLAVMGPVISALGCQCCPLPTVALSTHTGFPNPERVSFSDAIPRYWDHYVRMGVEFEGILTGYFASPEQISQAEVLAATELFIVDPILGDHGTFYTGMGPAQAAGLRRLCAKADLVLPNLTEAAILTDREYTSDHPESRLKALTEALLELGAKKVVLTGIPWSDSEIGSFGFDGKTYFSCRHPRKPLSMPGTGDLFSAVTAASLLRGENLADSAALAGDFVCACLAQARKSSPFGAEFENSLLFLGESARRRRN